MKMIKVEYNLFFILIIFFGLVTSCNYSKDGINSEDIVKQNHSPQHKSTEAVIVPVDSVTIDSVKHTIQTANVLVVTCFNGYEYAMHGYDFNPIIERELNKFETVNVLPFPYKTLMGVSYQGVFDIKYCPPIIEKVDADYLVLTRFTGNRFQLNNETENWGYETRIIDCKLMTQTNSMKASDLNSYEDLEAHIKKHIDELKEDLLK